MDKGNALINQTWGRTPIADNKDDKHMSNNYPENLHNPGNPEPYREKYGQHPFDPPYGNPQNAYPGSQPEPKTSLMAILSLVSAFIISLGAVVMGHIALSQIKKSGEKGKGFAVAGIILGYLGLVAGAVWIVFALVVGIAAVSAPGASPATATAPSAASTASPSASSNGEKATGIEKFSDDPFCNTIFKLVTQPDIGNGIVSDYTALSSTTQGLFQDLGEQSSPNQQVYSDYFSVISGSSDRSSTEVGKIASDYVAALDDDMQYCMANG